MSEIHKTAQRQENNDDVQEKNHKTDLNVKDKNEKEVLNDNLKKLPSKINEKIGNMDDVNKSENVKQKNQENEKFDVKNEKKPIIDKAFNVSKKKDDKVDDKNEEVIDKDEEICFESRARIYRYNTEKASWKERGTGKVQIMRHKETKMVRILMRRDLTFIICCNHFITSSMYLKPLETSKNTFTWYTAGDHYDGITSPEVMAIKLPTTSLDNFKTIFNYAINENQDALTKTINEYKNNDL